MGKDDESVKISYFTIVMVFKTIQTNWTHVKINIFYLAPMWLFKFFQYILFKFDLSNFKLYILILLVIYLICIV